MFVPERKFFYFLGGYMKGNLESLLNEIKAKIAEANSLENLTDVFNIYYAKKGKISELMQLMRNIPNEEKAEYGKEVNALKEEANLLLASKKQVLEQAALSQQLEQEKIDLTLPGKNYYTGGINPLFLIKDEIENIFIGMGYEIAEGPEIEADHFNFELLNIPADHPARDMQDSFYIDEKTLLRTHTSPVQARVMQEKKGQPIKIICPGKVFRRDDDDATHSHQFAQVEGLVIDKNINMANLKATLELFIRKMFGEKREIRLRSSYFPFTEPSVEVDVSCFECGGKGCSVCKGTGWIEILGAGMVHPNVLQMNGYNPEEYQGFAFGIGIERVAMLRYGIDDIRKFYTNDIRFLQQYVRIK
jgi:phenylalanyl-tRNA synthetase alpha chain